MVPLLGTPTLDIGSVGFTQAKTDFDHVLINFKNKVHHTTTDDSEIPTF